MQRQAIERLLPAAYQRAVQPGSVLSALLDVMEGMHAPNEEFLANMADLFDPYRTPDPFVSFLARWLALDHAVPDRGESAAIALGRLRDLVAEGARIAQWRGTADGMRWALRLATGLDTVLIEEPLDRPFHIVVHVPASAGEHVPLIVRLVDAEKPAACTSEVVVDPQ